MAECKQCSGPRGVTSDDTCGGCAEFCHLCFVNGAGKCDPDKCFLGYTLDAANTCIECSHDCKKCSYNSSGKQTECVACYGLFGLTAEKKCAACAPNCDGCTNSGAGKCDSTECIDRFTFDEASKTCKRCPSHCSSCRYINNNATCIRCDDHFGINTDNKTCGVCSANCDGCATSGAGKCDPNNCHIHYALDTDTETCKPCTQLENCINCTYHDFVCTSCLSPYELTGNATTCSGESANVLHAGPWMTVYAATASMIVCLVTGLVV
ncbi:hypothetical protein NP493_423g02023 [Ridgeia piscesae]|uniref:Uncharacterized protein n=1 Tax=Ridgeia piscesae TaxID=27915 RepID=A0AAD9L083_RIDPI|nr:hypothetical protein NP493_423g02023 [Ridgeia piscesae]